MNDDFLAGVLRGLALPGWNAGVAACQGAWTIDLPAGAIGFFALRSGTCEASVVGREANIQLSPCEGFLTSGRFSVQLKRTGAQPVRWRDISQVPYAAAAHDAPTTTEIVYGRCPASQFIPSMLALLPKEIVKLSMGENPMLCGAPGLIDCIFHEAAQAWPGCQALIDRVAQALFMQLVRAHAVAPRSPQEQTVFAANQRLPAVLHPAFGPVLGVIHSQLGEPWTVKTLAKQAGMAKSAFSEQFREIVGQPPLQYLTEVRMRKACELLHDSGLSVKQIAPLVGYESTSAFSTAFKRRLGRGPADYRKVSQSNASGKNESDEACSVPLAVLQQNGCVASANQDSGGEKKPSRSP